MLDAAAPGELTTRGCPGSVAGQGVLLASSMMRCPRSSFFGPFCVQSMSSSSTEDGAPGKRRLQSPEEGAGPASWVVKRQRSGALIPGSNEVQRSERHTGTISPAPSAGERATTSKLLCSPHCMHRLAVTVSTVSPPNEVLAHLQAVLQAQGPRPNPESPRPLQGPSPARSFAPSCHYRAGLPAGMSCFLDLLLMYCTKMRRVTACRE